MAENTIMQSANPTQKVHSTFLFEKCRDVECRSTLFGGRRTCEVPHAVSITSISEDDRWCVKDKNYGITGSSIWASGVCGAVFKVCYNVPTTVDAITTTEVTSHAPLARTGSTSTTSIYTTTSTDTGTGVYNNNNTNTTDIASESGSSGPSRRNGGTEGVNMGHEEGGGSTVTIAAVIVTLGLILLAALLVVFIVCRRSPNFGGHFRRCHEDLVPVVSTVGTNKHHSLFICWPSPYL
ncbi:hypothetical protein ScPMuIL_011961 [Solemya velum]